MKPYVMDACALIAFFNDEEGADKVETILSHNLCLMSVVNVYEVCYDAAKTSGVKEGIGLYEDIRQLPVTIIRKIGKNVIKEAVYFKVNYKISVADSIALGVARTNHAILVTADHHEFDEIEKAEEELDFYWIR
ncbi:MAG: type II toxin-antitoxin system VapC family toxin [Deltaproteobacteria bacterium]|nr:MAG: type II toxin-antitoxin system VapC family toxin [Deltaproteobacteria bacterium]